MKQFAKDLGANYQGAQFPEGRGVFTQATNGTCACASARIYIPRANRFFGTTFPKAW